MSSPPRGDIARTEIFGPVLGIIRVDTVEDAIAFVNSGDFGNMACVFTNDGRAARRFRHEVLTGNVGINVGVAAPMAFFPFSGWRGSFFGDLHAQGAHAIEFYTQTKVVVERWPRGRPRSAFDHRPPRGERSGDWFAASGSRRSGPCSS